MDSKQARHDYISHCSGLGWGGGVFRSEEDLELWPILEKLEGLVARLFTVVCVFLLMNLAAAATFVNRSTTLIQKHQPVFKASGALR